jgi:hypothetical protein
VVVSQDWEFPDFSEDDSIKIVAVDFSAFRLDFLHRCYEKATSRLPNLSRFLPRPPPLYISGKWFNYFGLMIGVGFDWAYWFMTALPFRPCDYAQLWDSEVSYSFTVSQRARVHDRRSLMD